MLPTSAFYLTPHLLYDIYLFNAFDILLMLGIDFYCNLAQLAGHGRKKKQFFMLIENYRNVSNVEREKKSLDIKPAKDSFTVQQQQF